MGFWSEAATAKIVRENRGDGNVCDKKKASGVWGEAPTAKIVRKNLGDGNVYVIKK